MTLTLLAIFCSVSLLSGMLIALVGRRYMASERQITRRIKDFSEETNVIPDAKSSFVIRNDQFSTIPLFHRILQKMDMTSKLQELISQAGSNMKVGELILKMLVAGALGFAVSLFFGKMLIHYY